LDGDNPAAHLQLAHAHRGLGNTKEEIQACRQAIAIQGDFIDAWFHLGAAYLKKVRGPDAQVDYIETNGNFDLNDPMQLFYFSLGLLAMGMKDEAKEHLPKIRKALPAAAQELESCLALENNGVRGE